jgi:alcohol dehydrogenase, propanol-preferring
MQAMRLLRIGAPLDLQVLPDPEPGLGEARLRVTACGVCRTDLHVVDGELPLPALPLTPGHEIVGVVEALGAGAAGLRIGQRVGVGWLGRACHHCEYCFEGRENLCDAPQFTGYTRDGGYATHALVDAAYAYPLGDHEEDAQLAPLLCAGLIGWRALVMAGQGSRLGLYGFGAAGHIILQVAKWQGRKVSVFTRQGDQDGQALARSLGADWVGASGECPPEPLDSAIIFAPAGELVPEALRAVRKGGTVVCAGIHMSDIPSFPYRILWEERRLLSVANLTREDARDFLAIRRQAGVRTHVTTYSLAKANEALDDLRRGRVLGAAVLVP